MRKILLKLAFAIAGLLTFSVPTYAQNYGRATHQRHKGIPVWGDQDAFRRAAREHQRRVDEHPYQKCHARAARGLGPQCAYKSDRERAELGRKIYLRGYHVPRGYSPRER